MLSLSFENIRCEHGIAEDLLRAQLWIDADFEVHVPEGLLLSAPYWCVVELAIHLAYWLRDASETGPEFSYESMDDSQPNLLWFKRAAGGKWLVGSAWQNFENRIPHTLDELTTAVSLYIQEVLAGAQPYLGKKASNQFGIIARPISK